MTLSELNDLIRAALDDHEIADPYTVMPYVLDELEPSLYYDALTLCLPAQIKRVIHGRRQKTYQRLPTLREQSRTEEVRPGFHILSVGEMLVKLKTLGLFNERVAVNGEWKFVGDCTSADLRVLAVTHESLAATNHQRAALYRDIADMLDANGLRTLRDTRPDEEAA